MALDIFNKSKQGFGPISNQDLLRAAASKSGSINYTPIPKKQVAKTGYFTPTENVRTRDILRELPMATYNTIKNMFIEAPARTAASIGLARSGQTLNIGEVTGNIKLDKFLFGDQPLIPIEKVGEVTGKAFGLSPEKATKYGMPLGIAGGFFNILSVAPGGAFAKDAKVLAGLKDVKAIESFLVKSKNINIAVEDIVPLAKQLVKPSTEKEVAIVINDFFKSKEGIVKTIDKILPALNKTDNPEIVKSLLSKSEDIKSVFGNNLDILSNKIAKSDKITDILNIVDEEKNLIKKVTKERGLITSIKESKKYPQEFKDIIEGNYNVKPMAQTTFDAERIIKSDPLEAEKIVLDNTNKASMDIKNEVSRLLTEHYLSVGDTAKATEFALRTATEGTEAGRAINMLKKWGDTTPAGAWKELTKKVDDFNGRFPKRKIEIPPEVGQDINNLAKKIQGMAEGREKNIAIFELQKKINSLIPSSILDKGITLWKAGLLTSLRTHERNLLSNTIHYMSETIKDAPAALNDILLSLKTGERTTTFTTKGTITGAREGLKKSKDIITIGFDPEKAIKKFDIKQINWGKSKIGKILEAYTETVFRGLSSADKPFYQSAYARSLYDQAGAQAKNLKESKEFIEHLAKNPTENMINMAIKDAELAVFQNNNLASGAINSAKNWLRNQKTMSADLANAGIDIFLPFTGVPTSIGGQMIAYSPIGFLQGAINDAQVIFGGSKNSVLQREASKQIGRGIVGTAVLTAGAYLGIKGLITGKPKNEQERREWEAENKPEDSIMINGKWRSLGSIGPEAIVFLAGSEMGRELNEGGSIGSNLVGGAGYLTAKFVDQPVLSGVQQPLSVLTDPQQYKPQRYFGSLLASTIPNIIKDTAKTFDPLQRETTENPIIDQIQSGIPIWRNALTEKRDVFGNEIKNELAGGASYYDLFNSKTPSTNPIVLELQRLNSTGDNITPSKLSNDQTIFGFKVKLTNKELNRLEKMNGEKLAEYMSQVITSDKYLLATGDKQKDAVKKLIDLVRTTTKEEILAKERLNKLSSKDKAKQISNDLKTFDSDKKKEDYLKGLVKSEILDKSIIDELKLINKK